MVTRRTFNLAAASLAGTSALQACSSEANVSSYAQAVRDTWRHSTGVPGDAALLRRELVRYATLAPSSHNTQCWKFGIEPSAISILPDFSRRCPAVDPDDHHLFVSLGCAAENLIQAALANGLAGEASFDAARSALRVALTPTQAIATPLFQ
ncbi:MAG: hypothetical protein RL341_1430, partial [Pseudomonadota bacterium]